MTSMDKLLQQLGFSKNEITVYLALFDLGKCKAGELIEYTKLHRNLVYTALEEFVQRGLVTKTEVNGVATFSANDPNRLLEEIDQKRELAEQFAEEIKKKQEESPREVTVYEGLEGLKRATTRTLSAPEGETVYIFGAAPHSTLPDLSMRSEKYDKSRIKRGIHFKGLYGRTTSKDILDQKNQLPLTEAKYMPQGIEVPMWFNVCGDISSIVAVDENPLAFNIKSKTIADGLKKYFEYLWHQEVNIVRGLDALRQTFLNMIDEVGSNGEYTVLGAYAPVDEVPYLDPIFEEVHSYRVKKKVHVKMLVYKEFEEKMKSRFRSCGDPDFIYSHSKPFLTQPPSPFQINLYNGKTFLIFYGEEPTVISFEKPEVYIGFKSYFDQLWDQETLVLRGPQALQNVWLESLDYKELRLIGAREYFIDQYPKLFKSIEEKARTKKDIIWKNIVDPSVRGHKITQFPWTQTKYSLSNIKNPNVIWLYGNKVAISNWTEEEPVVFISTNKQLIQSYNDYFDSLWNNETEILTKQDGITELCEKVLDEGKDLYLIGANTTIMNTDTEYYADFTKRRIKKNIKIHMLANEGMRGSEFSKLFLSEVHYLSKIFESPMVIWIFGDYVANVMWSNPQTIFLILDKNAAESYRKYYNDLKKLK